MDRDKILDELPGDDEFRAAPNFEKSRSSRT